MLYEQATVMQAAYQQQILANIDRYEQRIRRDMHKLITSFASDAAACAFSAIVSPIIAEIVPISRSGIFFFGIAYHPLPKK